MKWSIVAMAITALFMVACTVITIYDPVEVEIGIQKDTVVSPRIK